MKEAVDARVAAGRAESTLTVAMLGLAFKPNIDDLRESPALSIAEKFAASTGARLLLVEPNIDALSGPLAQHALVSVEDAVAQADILVLLVRHSDFKGIDAKLTPGATLLDIVGNSYA
ncbi:UDP-glucose 6-dehydrogenase YwqF [compost metagenome]